MRLCWLTDIHLNFVDGLRRVDFAQEVAKVHADAVIITGDIDEAPGLEAALRQMWHLGEADVYFVLGNHDFYRDGVEATRARCRDLKLQTYLHGHDPIALTEHVGLVGVDGWADGRLGRARESDLIFTDWAVIDDFKAIEAVTNMDERLRLLREFAEESATQLERTLTLAVEQFRHILVATHIPPFARAAGHNGSPMADVWVPWLACKATGDVLERFADAHPGIVFEVLCGHTHVAKRTHERPNLAIRTGHATYRAPVIQGVAQIDVAHDGELDWRDWSVLPTKTAGP